MKNRATPIVTRFQVYMLWRCENDLQGNHEIFEERVNEAKHLNVDNMKSTNNIAVLNIKICRFILRLNQKRGEKIINIQCLIKIRMTYKLQITITDKSSKRYVLPV